MVQNHVYFDLGDIPPGAWAVIIMLISMLVGKLADIQILFILGAIGLGTIVILIIIDFVREFF